MVEEPKNRGGGAEPFQRAVSPKKQSRQVAAIGIAKEARRVIVLREEERSVIAVRSVFEKQLIHRTQKLVRLLRSVGALAAQIGLQVGHQQRGGHAFPGDV